ncbi:unnamed protein product [Amoebophrya sp. A25]|nr:unnamed protein product [Amoebophrya sp. A25]|eukprot:GSA25T00017690001.1
MQELLVFLSSIAQEQKVTRIYLDVAYMPQCMVLVFGNLNLIIRVLFLFSLMIQFRLPNTGAIHSVFSSIKSLLSIVFVLGCSFFFSLEAG